MGFSFSSLAVRGRRRSSVLDVLGLRATGEYEECSESPFNGVELPSGWYLVIADRDQLLLPLRPMLGRLSEAAEVLTLFIEEHTMCSAASMWSEGREVWSVLHASAQGLDHLDTEGELPAAFTSISERPRAEQEAAGGRKADVDFIFNIPVELFESFTGYRYSQTMPALGERPFEVLTEIEPGAKRSWIRRLLGV